MGMGMPDKENAQKFLRAAARKAKRDAAALERRATFKVIPGGKPAKKPRAKKKRKQNT